MVRRTWNIANPSTGPEDFTRTTHDVLAALKEKGILAETIGNQPVFQFSI